MSDKDQPADAKPAKKKKKKLLVMLIGLLVVAGGGAGAGLYASQALGGHHDEAEDPNKPKLVPRDGVSKDEVKEASKGKKFDRTKFKATYYPLKESFTANLADEDAFVQVGLGVATYYDERVVQAVEEHEMAIRSAVLMTLSQQDAMALTEPDGKVELRKELRDAVNEVLESKEGFGGIDDVYFTSFVVQ